MATTFQIRKIHMLKNILTLNDVAYRAILSYYDKESSKELSFAEAEALIRFLEEKAAELGKWEIKKKYDELVRDNNMATPAQLRMIEAVWKDIVKLKPEKYRKEDLRHFVDSKFTVGNLMFLSKKRANEVIGGLTSMRQNYKKSAATLNDTEENKGEKNGN